MQVIRLHDEFLDTCMKECMLHNPQLLKILTKLMSTVMHSDADGGVAKQDFCCCYSVSFLRIIPSASRRH